MIYQQTQIPKTMDPVKGLIEAAQKKTPQNRPFVTLSFAQSLDGSLTLKQGRHTAISSDESFQLTHRIRSVNDGLLIGIGSVLADDPRLTVRIVDGENPRPVILDSLLRFPITARMLQNDKKPWIFTSHLAAKEKFIPLEKLGAKVFVVPHTADQQLDLCHVLDKLHQNGLHCVMVEGGGRIITSFLKNRLADYLILTISPQFFGGYPAIQDKLGEFKGNTKFALAPNLKNSQTIRYQEDIVLWGEFDYPENQPC